MVRPCGTACASAASTPRSRITGVAWNASGANASCCAAVTACSAVKGSLSNMGSPLFVGEPRCRSVAAALFDDDHLQAAARALQLELLQVARHFGVARLQLHRAFALLAVQRDAEILLQRLQIAGRHVARRVRERCDGRDLVETKLLARAVGGDELHAVGHDAPSLAARVLDSLFEC